MYIEILYLRPALWNGILNLTYIGILSTMYIEILYLRPALCNGILNLTYIGILSAIETGGPPLDQLDFGHVSATVLVYK